MSPKFAIILLLVVFLGLEARSGQIEQDPDDQPESDPGRRRQKPKKIKIKAKLSKASRGALGQGFEIHKEDLLTKQFKSTGAKIFEDLPLKECVKSDKLGQIQKDSTFYSSTKSLYQSVSTNTKVEASLEGVYTLGASVEAATNNIASGEKNIQGTSLNFNAYSYSSGLKKDCINEKALTKDIVKDFEALPKKVDKPWKKASWREYNVFLSKYGSHIVKEVISGSSIYQYVFAESDKKFTQKDFTVKACLSLAGPSQAGEVGVSACSEVSKKDIDKSSSQSMKTKLVVRGGKSKTRAKLSGKLSPKQINKFMKQAKRNPSPIKYHFEPIWKILKIRYIGKDHYAKAVNLEQYFKGYLNYGCAYEKTSGGLEKQKFDLDEDSDPESPTYVCKLRPEGCQSEDDCHYRAAFWCSCYGESCIRYKEKDLPSGETKTTAEVVEKDDDWEDASCELSGLSCSCSGNRKNWKSVWRGESLDDGINDVHSVLLKKNRRDQAKRNELHC